MNNKRWDVLYINATAVTCAGDAQSAYGIIENAAIGILDGKICWLGPEATLPNLPALLSDHIIDAEGRCITPGLIDCHTHLVYAGNRSHEFEMRLKGATYEEIAKAGGGIRSTVSATRAASEDELFEQSLKRAKALVANGVTTIEIKSGYGLNLETELKILRVAKKIGETLRITIVPTFLGAHTVPEEFHGRADDYIHYVIEEMLPRVAEENLAKRVDVFCEKIAFSLAQTEKVFAAAQKYNLAITCHAEQLSDSGSAALSAKYNAQSVDHLEFLSKKSVAALAQSGSVAVLLPGAFYFLREKQLPSVDLLREHKIPIAIATDCNPGTSPTTSLTIMMNMACTLFRLTPEEALLGVTRHAAKALGLLQTHGTLELGKKADIALWDIKHPAELAYQIGGNTCMGVSTFLTN